METTTTSTAPPLTKQTIIPMEKLSSNTPLADFLMDAWYQMSLVCTFHFICFKFEFCFASLWSVFHVFIWCKLVLTILCCLAELAKLPILPPYLHPGRVEHVYGVNFASGGAGALRETAQGFVRPTSSLYLLYKQIIWRKKPKNYYIIRCIYIRVYVGYRPENSGKLFKKFEECVEWETGKSNSRGNCVKICVLD